LEEKSNNLNILTEEYQSDNKEVCEVCDGSGSTGDGICSSCNGEVLLGSKPVIDEICPDCHGSGSLADNTCSSCNGKGVI